jgi:hypothetical protein
LLHLQRYDEALQAFQKVEELAPGWFHVRYDIWLTQKLRNKELDHETFEILDLLENSDIASQKKIFVTTRFWPPCSKTFAQQVF